MSEEQLHKQSRQPVSKEEPAGNFPVNGRRRLLKGTVAIPVIMTLQSGAALALTSNLVGAIQDTTSAVKEGEDLLCIHPTDSNVNPRINPVDIGDAPTTTVDHTKNADGSPDLERQAELCQETGGILVSATAWNSIAPPGGNRTTL